MANQQLIQGAKDIGKSRMLNQDPGKLIGEAFEPVLKRLEESRVQAKKLKEESDARVQNYLDNIPLGEGIEKIPSKYRNSVNAFLLNGRNEYADLAKQMGKLKPTDDKYQANVLRMNQIKNSFVNLNKQFEGFVEFKDNFLVDKDKDVISNGNDINDINFLSQVATDELDVEFTPEGNIVFNRDGKAQELSQLPKYFNKTKAIKPLLALNTKLYSQATPIGGAYEKAISYEVKSIIGEIGRPGLLSLATDDNIFEGGLGIVDQDLLTDPSRNDELKEVVTNAWMEMLKGSAQEGYDFKQRQAEAKQKHEIEKINARKPKDSGVTDFSKEDIYDTPPEENTFVSGVLAPNINQ